jgi:hypothetical protein
MFRTARLLLVMRHAIGRSAMLLCVIACSLGATTQPARDGDAVGAYRAYVASIRSGAAAKALERVEPVPESVKALVATYVEMRIEIEAVKTEIAKQFNPPKPDRGDVVMGEFPDDWLKDVVAEPVDA